MPETTKTPDRICSGCSRRCDLSRPGCRWGELFADAQPSIESGAFPGRHGHPGDRRGMRGPILASPRYREAALPEKAEMLLRELSMPRRGARDSQDRVLFHLAREDHMTQRDLTARLGIQPGSASEL
ncbi:MAG: MarR family transcriptional regulator, partial [Oscillospiraceae bacterium]|nr:MarR family transcriptional regulator [Oscillospiraceae bacterium]